MATGGGSGHKDKSELSPGSMERRLNAGAPASCRGLLGYGKGSRQ